MSEESRKPEEIPEEKPEEELKDPELAGEDQQETENQEPHREAENGAEETAGEEEKPDKEEGEAEAPEKKDKKTEQIEELTDRLQRSMAEFDNYRKRTEKEKAGMYVIGAKEVIEKILPVVDNFERGLGAAQEGDAFAEGMQMVYKQLMTALSDMGVEPIEA